MIDQRNIQLFMMSEPNERVLAAWLGVRRGPSQWQVLVQSQFDNWKSLLINWTRCKICLMTFKLNSMFFKLKSMIFKLNSMTSKLNSMTKYKSIQRIPSPTDETFFGYSSYRSIILSLQIGPVDRSPHRSGPEVPVRTGVDRSRPVAGKTAGPVQHRSRPRFALKVNHARPALVPVPCYIQRNVQ